MIDGGPLGTSRLTGRQVAYRNESTRYQPEERYVEPTAPAEQPRQERRRRDPEPVERSVRVKPDANFAWVRWLAIVLAVAVLGFGAWKVYPAEQSIASTINPDTYQAVFLSNGQVYFGKLEVATTDFMKLTNVYYLERQLTASGQSASTEDESPDSLTPTNENNFQLLKYSDVLYGSEDTMVISLDDIIRFENLRSDGVVAKAIANRR